MPLSASFPVSHKGREGGVTRSHHLGFWRLTLGCTPSSPLCLPLSLLVCPCNTPSAPMITHEIGVQTHLCHANSNRFKSRFSNSPPLSHVKGKGPRWWGKDDGSFYSNSTMAKANFILIPQEPTHITTQNPSCVGKACSYHQRELLPLW